MFHVKHRRLGLICGLSLLAVLAIGCGGGAASPRGWAEPVESGKTVIVSTGRGRLDGIDTDTNRGKWRFPNFWQRPDSASDDLKGIYGSPVVAADGDTTFVADYNGYVYAFKQSQSITAAQLQSDAPRPLAAALNLGEPVIGGLAIDPGTNDLFVTAGPKLVRLKYASDRLTTDWVFDSGADIWSVPVLNGSRIIFSSLDGNLYAVNASDGEEVWRYDSGDSGLVSTPSIVGNTVYVGGFDSKLHAVDLATGEGKWTFNASYWVWSAPIADSNRIIFGDFNGRLYAVDAANGDEIWQESLEKGAIVGSPAISNGVIVVATQDGWIMGLDSSSREIRWQTELNTSFTADLTVAQDKSIFIAPRGCVTPEGLEQKIYYYGVNPQTGELRQAQDIC